MRFRFTEKDVEGWSTILNADVGAASLKTDSLLLPVTDPTVPFELTETYPALYGRVRAGHEVSARVRLHLVGVQGHLILASKEDTQVFDATGTVPVTVGVELAL